MASFCDKLQIILDSNDINNISNESVIMFYTNNNKRLCITKNDINNWRLEKCNRNIKRRKYTENNTIFDLLEKMIQENNKINAIVISDKKDIVMEIDFRTMPDDILLKIMSEYLNKTDVNQLSQSCKFFNNLIENNREWIDKHATKDGTIEIYHKNGTKVIEQWKDGVLHGDTRYYKTYDSKFAQIIEEYDNNKIVKVLEKQGNKYVRIYPDLDEL